MTCGTLSTQRREARCEIALIKRSGVLILLRVSQLRIRTPYARFEAFSLNSITEDLPVQGILQVFKSNALVLCVWGWRCFSLFARVRVRACLCVSACIYDRRWHQNSATPASEALVSTTSRPRRPSTSSTKSIPLPSLPLPLSLFF